MPKPCVIQKQELAKLVESGEILVGTQVVEKEYIIISKQALLQNVLCDQSVN